MEATKNPHNGGHKSFTARHSTTLRYDFDRIDVALLPRAETLLNEWLPDGKLSGHEYTARNPTRADNRPGSFKINTATGIWEDFATGDNGPGLMSLFAYINRMDKPDAAAELAQRYGLQAASASDKPPPKAKPRDEWQPVTPVPETAPPPPVYTPKPGETVTRYDYRGSDGRLLHPVYRVDRAGPDGKRSKDFRPVTWCKHKVTGAHKWQWKAIPNRRPLYGLETLAGKVGAPVCICEGEKAVHAARQLLPAWACVTSSSGGKAGHLADWTPLAGRRVMIWRDADDEGTRYAQTVTAALHDAGMTSVQWLSLDIFGETLKKGYDAADALAAGWTADRLSKALQSDAAIEKPKDLDDEPAEGLPLVRIIPGNLNKVIDKAEGILLSAGVPLFDRGGQLVRPVVLMTDVAVDGAKIPAGSLAIKDITAGWLTRVFNEHAIWKVLTRDTFKRIDCPPRYAEIYLQCVGDWRVPTLTGIVEAPTLRADGTLLNQPGYDPLSGLYLDYVGKPVIVPENPAKKDALEALAIVKEIIAEFPFIDHASRSVALSSLLTAVVRRALRTAPFHCYDSPEKGTGKSLLANVSAIISTGRPATTATLATSDDENQKRLGAYLIRGVSFLNVDNVSHPVEGDFFCSLATEETVDPRVLGHSVFVKVKTNTVVVTITGNNLTLAGDVTRRALLCRIDAQMERPDARTFKIPDLKRHVADHRHELLGAALTALRAFVVAGRPAHDKEPYGSFYDWDRLVRGALLWLGEADPLDSRARIMEVDPTSGNLGALLTAWHELFGVVAMTTKEVVTATMLPTGARDRYADNDEDNAEAPERQKLREALHEALLEVAGSKDGQTISHGALGKYLAKNADKVTGGLRLERAGEFRRAVCWRVRNLEEKGKQEIKIRTQKTHTNSQNSHDPHNAVDGESVSIVSFDEFPPANFPNYAKRNFAPDSPNGTDDEGNWESLLQSAPPIPDEAR